MTKFPKYAIIKMTECLNCERAFDNNRIKKLDKVDKVCYNTNDWLFKCKGRAFDNNRKKILDKVGKVCYTIYSIGHII